MSEQHQDKGRTSTERGEPKTGSEGVRVDKDASRTEPAPPGPARERSMGRYFKNALFGVILPLIVLGAGAWAVFHYMNTQPRAERKGTRVRNARLVEVIPAAPSRGSDHYPRHGHGPARAQGCAQTPGVGRGDLPESRIRTGEGSSPRVRRFSAWIPRILR